MCRIFHKLFTNSMESISFQTKVDIALGCIYALLALASVALFIRFFYRKPAIKPNYVLVCQLFALKTVRCVYLFMPDVVWLNLERNVSNIIVEVIVFLLPEFLFVSISSLLICITATIYIRAMTLKQKIPRRYLWWVYSVVFGLILLSAIILFIVVAAQSNSLNYRDTTQWEGLSCRNVFQRCYIEMLSFEYIDASIELGIYIGTVAALIGLCCIVFALGLFLFFHKMHILPSHLRTTPKRIVILAVIILSSAVLKAVFVIKFHYITFYYLDHKPSDVLVWLFYLLLTEIIPFIAILIVLFTWQAGKRKVIRDSTIEFDNVGIDDQRYTKPLIETKPQENKTNNVVILDSSDARIKVT